MKTLTVGLVAFSVFCSAAVAGALDDSTTRITTSSAVRIAAVRSDDADSSWYPIRQAFSSRLSVCLATPDSRSMPVRIESAAVSEAAAMLREGKCDAVFVSGERLPAELKGAGFYSLRAVSEIGSPVRVFHFVLRSDDASTLGALAVAFERATSSREFQEQLGQIGTMRVVSGRDL